MTDIAHARRTDPTTSHVAAKKATHGLTKLRIAVLHIFAEHGPLNGSNLNRIYAREQQRGAGPACAWDSPRKRAGDLHRDGYLDIVDRRDGESVYALTDKGLAECVRDVA